MTNRSWYGDTKFTQGGRWVGLYGAYKHVLIAVGILIIGGASGIFMQSGPVAIVSVGLGYLWLIFVYFSYAVQSFGYLTRTKSLGTDITFQAAPRTGTILARLILGYLLVGIIFAVVAGLGGAIAYGMLGGVTPENRTLFAVLAAVAYITLLAFVGALTMTFITEPIIRHLVGTTTVVNIAALDVIRQRVTDKGADAEGFADALDWGGAI